MRWRCCGAATFGAAGEGGEWIAAEAVAGRGGVGFAGEPEGEGGEGEEREGEGEFEVDGLIAPFELQARVQSRSEIAIKLVERGDCGRHDLPAGYGEVATRKGKCAEAVTGAANLDAEDAGCEGGEGCE